MPDTGGSHDEYECEQCRRDRQRRDRDRLRVHERNNGERGNVVDDDERQ
jgi:hypothetical protein